MRKIVSIIVSVAAVAQLASCTNDDIKKPGYEYMPNMYRSPSYETYSSNPNFADSMTSRQPVEGTIARGNEIYNDYDRLPYPYPNTVEGYEAAGLNFKSPLQKSEATTEEGKVLYVNYCGHCHGATGKGDGAVAKNNGPIPPAYDSETIKNLPEGKMYHTITWGKNMMGSHASQVTPTQRWKIIMYIQTLQHPAGQTASASPADSTKSAGSTTKM
ncbi:MAG: cytochrome c [Bacteroidetes bacterium]|nr:cytochrome c [Bacteroidota bacterium]MBK8362795.1 cytochrome c [Bacteroidota bacterium]MBK9413858.1 cytochrome c [Bacteroidota bacterium]MBP6426524.1 cytochrome c [Bacteroidia bacterium]MBP6657021.1 cytochrome c [Bacteroidia bacterium]